MKTKISLLVFYLFLTTLCFSVDVDSINFKKNNHTFELCLGISPKTKNKNVVSSKGNAIYGCWYDYSFKVKNNFYAALIVNPLVGGDEYYDEISKVGLFATERVKDNYLLLNLGIGFKYKLCLSKSSSKNRVLIFSVGDLFSYKYLYKHSYTSTQMLGNPQVYSSYSVREKYNLSSNPIRFTDYSTAFPVFIKLSYCQKRMSFSINHYLLSQESKYGGHGFYEKFYTNFNIGLTL